MDKLATVIAVAALFLAALAFFKTPEATLGGFTNYDQLAVGSTTPNATYEIAVGGTGTTTIGLSSSGSTGTCIEMKSTSGSTTKAYVTGTSSPTWTLAAGQCK
jgi:hypothetical protein